MYQFILFLLFALLVNCLEGRRTACAIPTRCSAPNLAANPPFNSNVVPLLDVLDTRFFPTSGVEACNIRNFCMRNPPGNYCYIPTYNLNARNCRCAPVAFVQCPFGLINLCKRGFTCHDGANASGSWTATCQPISTTNLVTSVFPSAAVFVSTLFGTTILASPMVEVDNDQTITSYMSSTLGLTNLSSFTTTAFQTSIISGLRPIISYPPIPPMIISVSSCGGTRVGRETVTNTKLTGIFATIQTGLCVGPFPVNSIFMTKTSYVINHCATTSTVPSSS